MIEIIVPDVISILIGVEPLAQEVATSMDEAERKIDEIKHQMRNEGKSPNVWTRPLSPQEEELC